MSIADVAEAVRAALAGGYGADPRRIDQNIRVERINVNRPKLEDLRDWTPDEIATLGTIRVFVSTDDEILVEDETDRESLIYHYPIIIGIAAKPAQGNGVIPNENVDPLHELRTQLKDYFFKQDAAYALPDRDETAISIETVTDMDKASLREKRLFLAEFVVTFKGARSR